ncbi:MAG: hypothetical protein P8Y03_23055 [Anaerolineales bacterium]
MRDILVKILFAGLFLLIFLSVNPHQVMPAYADTSHCGTINSDEIWSSGGNVHVIDCSVTVAVGVTLTISEGTIIKFKPGTRLLIDGALKVLGTSGNPVYFTSYADDTVGGDTNGNGASTGSQGNWSDIRFTDTSDDANSLIDYAIIRYGGDNYLYNLSGAVTLLDASPTIQNTTINDNEYCAIYANLHAFPTLDSNTLEYNERNGFCLSGGTLDIDAVWDVTDTSYFLLDSATVAVNQTLTVDPGVIVKFGQGKRLAVNGALKVLGTSGNPVYFTSYADDTVGGDTNGNGASTGSQGNWSDIRFTDTSDDANSLIDYAIIRYGGDNYLYNLSGAVTLLDASPTISYTQIYQNEYAGILASGSQPKLTCNDIYLNSNFGIYNQTTATVVDASNQWWGASSGPYHETSNPNGEGNTVTDGVNFIPWRLQPCTLPPEPEKLKVFLPLTIRD